MNKKGQGLPIQTIITAIIVLIVIAILAFVVIPKLGTAGTSITEAADSLLEKFGIDLTASVKNFKGELKDDTITLSWEGDSKVSSYKIYVEYDAKTGEKQATSKADVSRKDTSYQIKAERPGEYKIRFIAYDDEGNAATEKALTFWQLKKYYAYGCKEKCSVTITGYNEKEEIIMQKKLSLLDGKNAETIKQCGQHAMGRTECAYYNCKITYINTCEKEGGPCYFKEESNEEFKSGDGTCCTYNLDSYGYDRKGSICTPKQSCDSQKGCI